MHSSLLIKPSQWNHHFVIQSFNSLNLAPIVGAPKDYAFINWVVEKDPIRSQVLPFTRLRWLVKIVITCHQWMVLLRLQLILEYYLVTTQDPPTSSNGQATNHTNNLMYTFSSPCFEQNPWLKCICHKVFVVSNLM